MRINIEIVTKGHALAFNTNEERELFINISINFKTICYMKD